MLAQQIVNGLTLGAVYTLVALSFSLVMGILSILNLAIGELFMLGGFIGFTVIAANFPLPVALLAGMAAGALTAIVIEKIAYEPLRDAPPITPLLSTLGFSIILQNVVTNIWGSDPLQLPSELFDDRLTLGSLNVGVMQLAVIGVTIVLVGALAWLIQRTSAGRALRAVAENRDVARLLGRLGRPPDDACVRDLRRAGWRCGRARRPALCGDHAVYRRRYRAQGDRRHGDRRHDQRSGARCSPVR